jgi:hypothetical protein
MNAGIFKRTGICIAIMMALSACDKNFESRQRADADAVAAKLIAASPGSAAYSSNSALETPAAPAAQQAGGLDKRDLLRVRQEPVSAPPKPAPSVRPESQLTSSAATYTDSGHKFVRTAHAQFGVADVYKSALAIEDAVAAQGGFVTGNQISSGIQQSRRYAKGDGTLTELTEYIVRGTLTVRVPSDKTQAFLRAIAVEIEFLDQRGFEAQDVQFDLLRQHLSFIRSQETQQELGQITRDGGKLPDKADVVTARNDAKAARDEAKVAQKELEDRIAYSIIDLSLVQPAKVRQAEVIDTNATFREHAPGFFTRLADSTEAGWDRAQNLLLGAVGAWPFWLAFAAFALLARRAIKARWFRNT